jgi:hypothetical protein
MRADHSGRAVFARSNVGIIGSNPNQGMDVCVCVYSVFVLFCMQLATLWRADPPVQGVLPSVYRLRN